MLLVPIFLCTAFGFLRRRPAQWVVIGLAIDLFVFLVMVFGPAD